MLISVTIFMSIFTFFQFSQNAWIKENKNIFKKHTPFIFFIALFCIWGILTFILYNSEIKYELLYYLYLLSYIMLLIIFSCYYLKFLFENIKNMAFLKFMLSKIPILVTLVFFSTILLFYHKMTLPSQSDQNEYYYLMNLLHVNGTYSIYNSSNTVLLYSNVGFYQLGASLTLDARLFLMPYFTMYIYFYIVVTTTYFLLDWFLKSKLKINIIFIALIIIFVLFYMYYNSNWGYIVMVGNIESAYLLSLLLIPTFIINKNHYEFAFIFFSYLFYNETAILVTWIYVFCYICVMLFYRKKVNYTLTIFMIDIILLIFSIYLIFTDFLYMKGFDYNLVYLAFRIIPFLAIVFFIMIVFLYTLKFLIIDTNRLLKLQNWYLTSKINYFWYKKTYLNLELAWFFKNKLGYLIKTFICLVAIVCIFLGVFGSYTFNLSYFFHDEDTYFIFLTMFILLIFTICTTKLILTKMNKIHIYFIFYFFFIIITFALASILNFAETNRIYYASLFVTYGSAGFIHDLVIFIFLFFCAKSLTKRLLPIKKKTSYFLKSNSGSLILSSISVTLISIIPINNAVNSYFFIYTYSIKNVQNNVYGGLSYTTIKYLSQYNFDDKLVFASIPLPMFNLSSKFNINHSLYGLYYSSSYFWNRIIEYNPFYNIDGQKLKKLDALVYKNDILPYYNYIVIRTNDPYFTSIINSLKQYKLIDTINNQISIYVNTNVDAKMQDTYMKYNNNTF